MPTLGERLEEARKRQGISVREAAESTKVHSDFLISFENNDFDFDMPEVYRHGFLKLYARYLKLDVDQVMADYDTLMTGSVQQAKGGNKEFFGRMDLPEQTKSIGGMASEPPGGDRQESKRFGGKTPPSGAPAESIEMQSDASLYWKIGLIFVGGFLVLGVIAIVIQLIAGSGKANAESVVSESVLIADGGSGVAETEGLGVAADTGVFTIIASGDVLNVMVRQDNDGEKLFSRSMNAGEQVTLSREGPVRIVSSDIDKIKIELNGQVITSPSRGIGQIKLGSNGAEN